MEVTMPNTDGTLEKMEDLTSEPESDMVTVVCGDDTYFIPVNKLIDNSQFFARALQASHGRYNLTIQSMIEFRLKMIQFNF